MFFLLALGDFGEWKRPAGLAYLEHCSNKSSLYVGDIVCLLIRCFCASAFTEKRQLVVYTMAISQRQAENVILWGDECRRSLYGDRGLKSIEGSTGARSHAVTEIRSGECQKHFENKTCRLMREGEISSKIYIYSHDCISGNYEKNGYFSISCLVLKKVFKTTECFNLRLVRDYGLKKTKLTCLWSFFGSW